MALPAIFNRDRGRRLAAIAALVLFQGCAAGGAAFATRALFAAMHGSDALPPAALAALVAAGAAIALTRVAARVLGERLGQDYAREVRAALFDRAARMPARAVAERRAGYMSLRFVGDMTAFRNWIGLGIPRLVAGAILIPATLVILVLLDPVFGLVVLPVIGVTLLCSLAGGRRLVGLQRTLRQRRARIAADMAERMPLAPHLDRLGRRGKELALLDKRTDALIRAALRHRRLAETLRALPELAGGLAAALLILAGYAQGVPPAGIAAALATMGLLLGPLRDLGGVLNHRAAYRAAAIKAEAALARKTRDLYRGGRAVGQGPIDVTFEGVALPSGRTLDMHIDGGAEISLPLDALDCQAVGDALLGLDDLPRGRILLSGVDLRDLSRGSLRRGVLRIGTSPEILQGSLRRVLLMGVTRRIGDPALADLAASVGLGPALARLGGLDGTVREGGGNLTRAERVSLCIARAHLIRPRLVIVDTSCDAAMHDRIDVYVGTRAATVIRQGSERTCSRTGDTAIAARPAREGRHLLPQT